MENAATVLLKCMLNTNEINASLPKLGLALTAGAKDTAGPILGEARASIVKMGNLATKVRLDYISLLERVCYMVQCAHVSLDFLMMAEDAGVSDLVDADLADLDSTSSPALRLRHALLELESASVVLETCSSFWLSLHKAEKNLHELGETLLQVSNEIPRNSVQASASFRADSVLLALEEFCQNSFVALGKRGAPFSRSDSSTCASEKEVEEVHECEVLEW